MADLLMICPSRGRPQNADELWRAWQATTTGHADLLFGLDDDDPELVRYYGVFDVEDAPYLIAGPRLRMVGTLNACANVARNEYRYLGFFGDDHRPRTTGWDGRFCECLSGGTGIVYGNDLLQGEEMPTAVAMTSDIVETLGYMAPPSMLHLCVDLVWKDWGKALNRITYLDDVIIEHLHPANGKAKSDAGYVEVNSPKMIAADTASYLAYRDGDGMRDDMIKLSVLLDHGIDRHSVA